MFYFAAMIKINVREKAFDSTIAQNQWLRNHLNLANFLICSTQAAYVCPCLFGRIQIDLIDSIRYAYSKYINNIVAIIYNDISLNKQKLNWMPLVYSSTYIRTHKSRFIECSQLDLVVQIVFIKHMVSFKFIFSQLIWNWSSTVFWTMVPLCGRHLSWACAFSNLLCSEMKGTKRSDYHQMNFRLFRWLTRFKAMPNEREKKTPLRSNTWTNIWVRQRDSIRNDE